MLNAHKRFRGTYYNTKNLIRIGPASWQKIFMINGLSYKSTKEFYSTVICSSKLFRYFKAINIASSVTMGEACYCVIHSFLTLLFRK